MNNREWTEEQKRDLVEIDTQKMEKGKELHEKRER